MKEVVVSGVRRLVVSGKNEWDGLGTTMVVVSGIGEVVEVAVCRMRSWR